MRVNYLGTVHTVQAGAGLAAEAAAEWLCDNADATQLACCIAHGWELVQTCCRPASQPRPAAVPALTMRAGCAAWHAGAAAGPHRAGGIHLVHPGPCGWAAAVACCTGAVCTKGCCTKGCSRSRCTGEHACNASHQLQLLQWCLLPPCAHRLCVVCSEQVGCSWAGGLPAQRAARHGGAHQRGVPA